MERDLPKSMERDLPKSMERDLPTSMEHDLPGPSGCPMPPQIAEEAFAQNPIPEPKKSWGPLRGILGATSGDFREGFWATRLGRRPLRGRRASRAAPLKVNRRGVVRIAVRNDSFNFINQ